MSAPLLQLREVSKSFVVSRAAFGRGRRRLAAVRNVSLSLAPGEVLGVVGESGCGKSTLARLVLRLSEPTEGRILFDGVDITHLPERAVRSRRRDLQVVFQDPYTSLNPRMRVRDIVSEPLVNFRVPAAERRARVDEVLQMVGLSPESGERFPYAFSGGQRQRIGIARALAVRPKLLVCDEAVSALDVSVQAQILNLLKDIQRRFDLAMLFISHNLAVVRHLSDRVAVMYLGEIVELASERDLFESPLHPYTRALLSAVLEPSFTKNAPRDETLSVTGDMPSPLDPPAGCSFRTRCPLARDECAIAPELREWRPSHWARCHFAEEC